MDSSPGGTYDDHASDNDLKLDPGVPARRSRSSGCKCVLITILTSIASLTVFFIGLFLVNFFHLGREPNAALLYKTSGDTPVDPAAVVRPLIDEKQTFDIVATVWLRTNDSSSESTISTLPAEKVIFTGKIFEGLTLKDRGIHTTVNYTVPTEIFKNLDLTAYDLRASFVLIPTSPSLLDNLSNYSTWRNENIFFPPYRSWPDTGPAPTLQDKAIDSYGVSIELVRFLGIRSRCTSNAANVSEYTHELEDDTGDYEDSDDEAETNNLSDLTLPPAHLQPTGTSKGKPVLESHPYIVSHSFIRAVDATKLYDRKAYNRIHNILKTNACGQTSNPPNFDWRLCKLGLNQHMDTRLQLKITEEGKENKKTKHWAYAPHLSLSKSAWTPKDLIPVPVNREDCTKGGRLNDSEPLLPDQEFVDITWQIVYSGRSHFELMLLDAYPGFYVNMTEEKEVIQNLQHNSEIIQGLLGNQVRKGSHPRRIFFISILGSIIGFVIKVVNIRYWYTRSSTIGISKFATILLAIINLGRYFLTNYNMKNHLLIKLFAAIASLPLELSPFLMLKVIWRMEFGWNQNNLKGKGKWTEKGRKMKRRCEVPVPSVNFAKATHTERASDRLDARTPWIVKLSLFISCCLAYYFFSPATSLILIPPIGSPLQIDEHPFITIIRRSLISPGFIISSGLQLWFNYQSRTFSGKYKLNAILEGIYLMLNMLQYSTRVLGYRELRNGFSVHDLMKAFIVVGWCYQVVMLPTVSQGEVDDEVE